MKHNLNILLVGGGGRESALAAKLLESPRCQRLYSASRAIEGTECSGIGAMDFDAMEVFVTDHDIDLVVVGPEAPIVAGIYDCLSPLGVKVIAPDTECARLEGSKEFAKEFAARHAIPSPRFMSVTADTVDEGMSFLESMQPPYVVKADGLAAGRGVFITESLGEAKDMVSEMLQGLFGRASETVIIEEYIKGEECSMFLAVDGEDYVILPSALDYKRYNDGGKGPNTAGLGSISPAPCADAEFTEKVRQRIIAPTLRGLKEEGLDFRGFLYLGLISQDSEPLLLEYNARLGDPETQAIMPRIESDLVDLLEGIADRTLALKRITVSELHTAAVVLAAKGYPGVVVKGDPITGVESARATGCKVYEGAVKRNEDGRLVTNGGRIATVVGMASDWREASARASRAADMIDFEGKYRRTDIGLIYVEE